MNNNTDPTNGATVVTEPTTNAQATKEPEKTYTKDDIDNSFNAGFKKAKIEFEKSDDYKSYQEWKKTNQNDSEKLSELQTNYDKVLKENEYLKASNKVAESDVKPEFKKFVTSEVMNLVNDTTDFETALKNYKKDNTQYFGEVVVKKVQSSPNLNSGGAKTNTVNDIFNSMIRGN